MARFPGSSASVIEITSLPSSEDGKDSRFLVNQLILLQSYEGTSALRICVGFLYTFVFCDPEAAFQDFGSYQCN